MSEVLKTPAPLASRTAVGVEARKARARRDFGIRWMPAQLKFISQTTATMNDHVDLLIVKALGKTHASHILDCTYDDYMPPRPAITLRFEE